MQESEKLKLIAMYFTQLHAIPENDEWWGKGFTDWVNVKKAEPLFSGHYQPRVPLDNNYYDQSQLETIRGQIDLAKKYGLYGFCHYHYWFDGKQLLETPTNIVLDNPELDFPFCLSWANETWSKRWDGRDHHILIKQTHVPSKKRWQKHFEYLIRAWKDDRAIKIDGKPVFIIYRPQRIDRLQAMLDYWREQALKAGLKGIYIIYQSQYEISRKHLKGIDAVFQFQPFNAIYSSDKTPNSSIKNLFFRLLRILPNPLQNMLRTARDNINAGQTVYSYDEVWKKILEKDKLKGFTTYRGAFVDWDNTARYGERATVFQGGNPERFTYWFSRLVDEVCEEKESDRLIFLNAWNEWAEGAYLEPDKKYGYDYLEAVKKVLASADPLK